ncbi:MAG: acylneuraminate cytidylyltransferase family protein [archaeon]
MIKQNILFIIPARGGSKSLSKKNTRLFNGKPLIKYTIDAAKNANMGKIIVSTEDKEIKQICVNYGVQIIDRPKKLATDRALIIPVIKQVLKFLDKKEDYRPNIIVLLQPTSPLRTARHIKEAINYLIKTNSDSIVSITPLKEPLEWVFRIDVAGFVKRYLNTKEILRRQDAEQLYYLNGAIFAAKTEYIMKSNSFICDKTVGYLMQQEDSIDIDTGIDFFIAEKLMLKRYKKD